MMLRPGESVQLDLLILMERNVAKHALGLNFGQKLRGNFPVHKELSLENLAQPLWGKRLCADNPWMWQGLSSSGLAPFKP